MMMDWCVCVCVVHACDDIREWKGVGKYTLKMLYRGYQKIKSDYFLFFCFFFFSTTTIILDFFLPYITKCTPCTYTIHVIYVWKKLTQNFVICHLCDSESTSQEKQNKNRKSFISFLHCRMLPSDNWIWVWESEMTNGLWRDRRW